MTVPPAMAPMPESVKVFMVLRVPQMCSYPIGEVKSRDFRYCDAPAAMGKVYCPEHCAVCFVTPAEVSELRRWERERA
jgi:GcrA cell cycle regulator